MLLNKMEKKYQKPDFTSKQKFKQKKKRNFTNISFIIIIKDKLRHTHGYRLCNSRFWIKEKCFIISTNNVNLKAPLHAAFILTENLKMKKPNKRFLIFESNCNRCNRWIIYIFRSNFFFFDSFR